MPFLIKYYFFKKNLQLIYHVINRFHNHFQQPFFYIFVKFNIKLFLEIFLNYYSIKKLFTLYSININSDLSLYLALKKLASE